MDAPLSAALGHLAGAAPRSARLWPALRSLGPVLAAHPAALRRLAPPPALADQWARDLRRTRATNLVLLAELEAVLLALAEAGVPAVVFKGAAALDHLYPDPGLRPMDDADLLIAPADRDRAGAALRRLGFELRPAEPGRLGPVDDLLHGEWTFRRQVGQLSVEIDLHWHLVADARLRRLFPGLDETGAWRRARPTRLGRAEALVLDPVDAALVTALAQVIGHPWSHPLGYLDLRLELAAMGTDELAVLARRAADAGLTAPCWWSLRFCERLFGGDWAARVAAPTGPARALADVVAGQDWLGTAPFRREMAARDLFLLLVAGPRAAARGLRGRSARGGPPDPRGAARTALAIAGAAARALAS